MFSHYSILSVQIRPEIQEKLSIGFLLVGSGKVFFNISKNKLSAARGLLPENSFKILKDSLHNIEAKAKSENDQGDRQLLIDDSFKINTFSIQYIEYLSRYSNNILNFSSPKQIDIKATEFVFKNLFHKYVDDELHEKLIFQSKKNTVELFKIDFKDRLVKHFNIDRNFTSKEIPSLIVPVTIDLFGKNDIPVYAQAVDLSKTIYHLENDLAQLFFLDAAFKAENKAAKAFVIAEEPSKKDEKQHTIWKNLKNSKQFTYIPLTEQEQVLEYAEEHGVKPVLEEEIPA